MGQGEIDPITDGQAREDADEDQEGCDGFMVKALCAPLQQLETNN